MTFLDQSYRDSKVLIHMVHRLGKTKGELLSNLSWEYSKSIGRHIQYSELGTL